MAASLAVRISLEWSLRSLSARPWWASSAEPLGMILHATYQLVMLARKDESQGKNIGGRSRGVKRQGELACSLLSSFLASLTLPMLPAPMVLPRIHFPDWVGMVVRDLALVAEAAARGSAAEGWTGAGPVLWATVLAMSVEGELKEGWERGNRWRIDGR